MMGATRLVLQGKSTCSGESGRKITADRTVALRLNFTVPLCGCPTKKYVEEHNMKSHVHGFELKLNSFGDLVSGQQ